MISAYLSAVFMLLSDLWLWMLFSFLLSSFIMEFVPSEKFIKHFGKTSLKSLIKASFAGLITSVCSCGAIPLSASMRKKGSSTANALTFLLSTPWAGFAHLFIMQKFIGIPNTIILFFSSIAVTVISGLIFLILEKKKLIEGKVHIHEEGKLCPHCEEEKKHKQESLKTRLLINIPKHFKHISLDVGKFMLIGILFAGAVSAFISPSIISKYLGKENSYSILTILPISALIETCSEGFTILAGELFRLGSSLGVVFTMMMVGVSTDFTEITMLLGKFGKKSAVAYLIVSTSIVVCFAYLINLL